MTADATIRVLVATARPKRRLHIALKFLLVTAYMVVLFEAQTLRALALYSLLLLTGTMLLLLPLRLLYAPILASLAALLGVLWPDATAQALLMALCKVCCVAQVLAIFGGTTPPTELLRLFSARVLRVPGVHALMYVLSTTLAVLPSMQRDIRKSMDATILRGGSRLTFLKPRTWRSLLLDVLVRTIYRSQRLADAVADRGFRLEAGLTVMPYQRLGVLDVALTVLLLLPGLVLLRLHL
ncbi:MAG: CbiQ family ECF transporter T component [Ktedonobacterales bacterium]